MGGPLRIASINIKLNMIWLYVYHMGTIFVLFHAKKWYKVRKYEVREMNTGTHSS